MAKHDLGNLEDIRLNLESWLREKLPGADQLTLGDLSFPEGNGESSVSLILKTMNKGVEQDFICRMVPLDSQIFSDHDLPLQYNLMKMAGENGIPVPPLLGYEADKTLVGSDFYVMGFVDGRIPTDNPPYAFGSWVTELSDDDRGIMWKNGLESIARVHAINLTDYDVSSIPTSADGESPVQWELNKFNALITDEIREKMAPVLRDAVDYLNKNMPVGGSRRLCWGDSRVGNIIWEDLKPNAVIDWEMAVIANPLQDVSWWYWIDYVNSVGFGVERLGGLPALSEIYDQWHLQTGLPIDDSDYYDLFALVRYAIILECKFYAMEKAGLGTIENFSVPFVDQQLKVCEEKLEG